MFDDLVDDSVGDAVQANQFLIVDNGHGALIDPGGNMTYNGLLMEMHN
jgi:flavorubredoxin